VEIMTRDYHTEHLVYGFILLPRLQPNASANFLKLDSGPSTLRKNGRYVNKQDSKEDSKMVKSDSKIVRCSGVESVQPILITLVYSKSCLLLA